MIASLPTLCLKNGNSLARTACPTKAPRQANLAATAKGEFMDASTVAPLYGPLPEAVMLLTACFSSMRSMLKPQAIAHAPFACRKSMQVGNLVNRDDAKLVMIYARP
jgi:hypothetical protein